VLLLGAGVSLAQQEQPAPALPETTQTALPVPVSVATPAPSFLPWIGERADYHVAFGVISAGKAALAVVDTETVDGKLCLHAMSAARSAKAFDMVFKVRDTVETWFAADSIYAIRFRKKLHEGKYRDEKIVHFDNDSGIVRWWDDGREKKPIEIEPRIQDVLSAGFKARTLPFAVGDTFTIKTHDVNMTYDLMVIVHARETVETLMGPFDSYKVEPVLKSGGLFKREKGARVFLWVTADDRRIIAKMESRVSFGVITAVIEAYTPPRGM